MPESPNQMARSEIALITPKVLKWGREQAHMKREDAAKKAGVAESKLEAWEQGDAAPTIRQARQLASAYRLPFAALYLDVPPAIATHIPRDLRRLAGTLLPNVSPAIHLDVRDSWEKREIALELAKEQRQKIPRFSLSVAMSDDPDDAAKKIRSYLNVDLELQRSWRDPQKGFNGWRAQVENAGVMVLQTSDVPLKELRAYSLYETTLPVIVINRKDVPHGRSFSLVHELVHLALHTEGICDLSTDGRRKPEAQRLEVFCNAVAGATLLPLDGMLEHSMLANHGDDNSWDDHEISTLSRDFSVSREAVLRRLLTLGFTDEGFYRKKREEYEAEYAQRLPRKGFVTPPVDAISLLGRPFVRLVLGSLEAGTVTTGDAADYLGLRLKHLPALAEALD